ncbi:hypothetical protein NDR87_26285 [Nocardia sp. CDC159]|uniref:Uncharacterized protein n=1 Tax=Nocardia pulmonis TaxID=2951408 RepID=A0A9X2IZI6_9NOCA|nr:MULTISPECIES: hypothetical protein [Nocardia]MCM6774956.1 hypothetical protein [Nocardia pulmonis]MCM6789887.1 hypothetical protein [Nocardia sp. CDC159]
MKQPTTPSTAPVALAVMNTALVPNQEAGERESEICSAAARYGFAEAPEVVRFEHGADTLPPALGEVLRRIVEVQATAVFMPSADHVGGIAGVLRIMNAVMGTRPPRVLMRGVFFTDDAADQDGRRR